VTLLSWSLQRQNRCQYQSALMILMEVFTFLLSQLLPQEGLGYPRN
jgi:hypothetical protein